MKPVFHHAWVGGALAASLLVLQGYGQVEPPRPAFCTAASTNDMSSASFDELVFHAQRYGSTPIKTAWKNAAREEVFRRGPDSLRWLVDHARIDNIMMQVLTEELVGKLKQDQVVPVLLEFLDAREPRSRRTAAFYLGNFTTPEHAARLLPLLADEDACGAAIRTLGKWKVKACVSRISPFLKHEKEGRRILAANALRDIGDAAAAPALIEALKDPLFTVRETAARALVVLGAESGQAMVAALPSAQGQQQRALIRALGETKSPVAAEALQPYLDNADPAIRDDAREAIDTLATRNQPGTKD